MIKKIFGNKAFFPLLILIVVGGFFIVNAFNYYKFPEITNIEPAVAYPGDLLIISGTHFGKTRNGAEVRIAGERPVTKSYKSWSDKTIEVLIPDDATSGMVTVTTRRGKSNGVLFSNREHIPVILKGPQKPGYPYIESVEPSSGAIGSLITIKGLNFSHDRGSSSVYFSTYALGDSVTTDNSINGMIKCSEIDYDYESWDEQLIKVYIPDGASSGNIKIKTDRGVSNALYYEVESSAGKKIFNSKMGVQVEYGVEVSNAVGNSKNGLNLWVPAVRVSPEQRNVETVAEPQPLWDDYLGLMRYHFSNLKSEEKYNILIKSWMECFSIETKINPQKVLTVYNEDRDLFKKYTMAEDLIPSDDERIIDASKKAVGRERNPFLKAEKIYNYVIDNMRYTAKSNGTDSVKNLGRGTGDSYTYAVIFTAMCRAVGIPSRPNSGILVYNNKQCTNHYWAEFYIEGFGWVPVDPVLGDGVRFGNFPTDSEIIPKDFYFGSMDNHHVTFTHGVVPVKKVDPQGKLSGKKSLYSMQSIYEESSGLSSYSSYWRA
ncbi:MAG: transglutaminase domain-containing protein, partial [Spirochaetales bacterium]|nr:transglutaminase domain-containing protein [Spirochaetales bacterium]